MESVSWMLIGNSHVMMVFDAFAVCLLASLFSVRRAWWLAVPVVGALVFTLGNIFFSRSILGYMPLNAWLEYQNLNGLSGSIFGSFRPSDVVAVVCSVLVALLLIIYKPKLPQMKYRLRVFVPSLFLVLGFHLYRTYNQAESRSYWVQVEFGSEEYQWSRDSYIFTHGVFWSALHQMMLYNNKRALSASELWEVESFLQHPDFIREVERPRNIFLIVVESLISAPIGQTIDGVEVTPTLNKLRSEGLYSSNMKSQVKYGESSDGQLIYFTGLLPSRSGVTVFDYPNNEFRGIGTAASDSGYQSILLNATGRTYWRKHLTCPKYGLDYHYAPDDYSKMIDSNVEDNAWLNDEQIFLFASHIVDRHRQKPIFMTVLTLSTHVPYDDSFDEALVQFPSVENRHYACYLQKLNYMDHHLGRFIGRLEADSLLEQSAIVVVSDHTAPDRFDSKRPWPLPMIICSKGIEHSEIHGETEQIDVYPTLLHLMGAGNRPYVGLGHSVLDMDSTFVKSTNEKSHAQRVSDLILHGDYWARHVGN